VFLNFEFLSFGVRKIILWKTFTCIKEDSKLNSVVSRGYLYALPLKGKEVITLFGDISS